MDTDGDGLLDAVEIHDLTDPSDPQSGLLDSDQDGLSDNFERQVSLTDPMTADTDGDGLDDGEEYFELMDRYRTDPRDADSDDDGLLDGNEGVDEKGTPRGGTSPPCG